MVENTSPSTPRRGRRRLVRAIAALGVTLGSLAVAAPSWAGPMMGC